MALLCLVFRTGDEHAAVTDRLPAQQGAVLKAMNEAVEDIRKDVSCMVRPAFARTMELPRGMSWLHSTIRPVGEACCLGP